MLGQGSFYLSGVGSGFVPRLFYDMEGLGATPPLPPIPGYVTEAQCSDTLAAAKVQADKERLALAVGMGFIGAAAGVLVARALWR